MREQRHPEDTMRWIRRGSAVAALLIGWTFILITNHFHITPPVVFVCLAYFAAISAVYTLYRTGANAVLANDNDDAGSWGRPVGELSELEREKRTLLKAIKEAEFDHQMGKLSKHDADQMIGIYRARAIEVIKEIDVQSSTSGKAGSTRDRILREARARIQVETKLSDAPAAKKKDKKDKGGKGQKLADKLADAVEAAAKPDKQEVGEAIAKAVDLAGMVEAGTGHKVVHAHVDPETGQGYAIVDEGANPDGSLKAESKSESKAESKSGESKPESKAESKSDESKPESKAESKADESKAESKAAESKSDKSKAESKTDESKSDTSKSESKNESKSDKSKAELKTDESKTDTSNDGSKVDESKSEPKPDKSKSEPKEATR